MLSEISQARPVKQKLKEQSLWIYQQLTQAKRIALRNDLSRRSSLPLGVVFYHRVANDHPNEWTMSCQDFERQLDWLVAHFDVIPLSEAQQRIRAGVCQRPTVAITFDDGYADNADFAIPELVKRGLPATYFVATDFIASGAPFPHDVANGLPLRPNTIEQLEEFSSLGIEIGAHTRSHCDLGRMHDRQHIRDEISGSAHQLEDWLGVRVRHFAFPFGLPRNTSQLAVDVIAEHGFEGFCTAYGAWNWPVGSRYHPAAEAATAGIHIRRIHADPGIERLKNWLTLDCRKLYDRVQLPFTVANPADSQWQDQELEEWEPVAT